jgi:hypothetical protein
VRISLAPFSFFMGQEPFGRTPEIRGRRTEAARECLFSHQSVRYTSKLFGTEDGERVQSHFQPDRIIRRVRQILLCSQVTFVVWTDEWPSSN